MRGLVFDLACFVTALMRGLVFNLACFVRALCENSSSIWLVSLELSGRTRLRSCLFRYSTYAMTRLQSCLFR